MTTRNDTASEIKEALDREVARRFDARRLAAGLERQATPRREGRGPLGKLPVALQWAGVAAAFFGAAVGVRQLYLEWTRIEPPAAAARTAVPAIASPLVADGASRGAAEPSPPVSRPARSSPPPARKPDRSDKPEPMPERSPPARQEEPPARSVPDRVADASNAPHPETIGEMQRRLAASAPSSAAHPAPPARPAQTGGAIGAVIAPPPPSPAAVTALVGGVRVESFQLGGRPLRPVIREVREIGATLVLAPAAFRSSSDAGAPRDAVVPAFTRHRTPPLFLLATATRPSRIVRDASAERTAAAVPGADTGAYYARLFFGSLSEGNPRSQGLMGDGLRVVPLREFEVWGDEVQERFLTRSFGLRSVVAVDGARIAPGADAVETEARFVAGVGGGLFDVFLRGTPTAIEGLHSVELRVSRRLDHRTHPEATPRELAATLLIENGRIVIVGLPGQDRDTNGPTIAFLALSPRFAEFHKPEDDEEIRVVGQDEEVEPPIVIERTAPEYPEALRGLHVAGKVALQAVIREDGSVDGVQVLRVPDVEGAEYLVEAAASAVREWRYLPARLHGEPVNVYLTVILDFTLR